MTATVLRPGRLYDYLSDAQWVRIYTGTTGSRDAGTEPPAGILAYSGMALDSQAGKLYLFGGGHNDYFGNEVWEFDVDNPGLKWHRHYPPDWKQNPPVETVRADIDDANFPGMIVRSNRPISRHTYASVEWVDHLDQLFAGGGSTYSGTGDYLWSEYSNTPIDSWLYVPATAMWDYQGAFVSDNLSSINTYSTSRQKIYNFNRNVNARPMMLEYDFDLRQWSAHAAATTGVVQTRCGTVDEQNDRLLMLSRQDTTAGAPEVRTYDLASQTWTLQTTSGTAPTQYDGASVCVSSRTWKALFVRGDFSFVGEAKRLDLSTWEWEELAGFPSYIDKPFGKWKWDSSREVAFLVTRTSANLVDVWAFKG